MKLKNRKEIIQKLLLLTESEDDKTSDSLSQGKTSLEKRQPGTIWVTSPGHWGAKNPAGNVKYFDAEQPAQNYADGLDDGPSGSSTSKKQSGDTQSDDQQQKSQDVSKTAASVATQQTTQKKYIKDVGGFVAKDKTLKFNSSSDVSDYKIGGIQFSDDVIPEEYEQDYSHNSLKLSNGKYVGVSYLMTNSEDLDDIENDPDIKPLSETNVNKYSAGVIIEEDDGRIWLVKPTNAYGGYEATFPKGGISADAASSFADDDLYTKNMELRTAAVREAFEETGLVVQLQDFLGDVERSTSYSRYFIAKRIGGSPINFDNETSEVMLLHPGEALNQVKNPYDAKLIEMYKQYRQQNPKEIKVDDGDEIPEAQKEIDVSPVYESRVGTNENSTNEIVLAEKLEWDKKGSNPGGRYRGKDGKERYVKEYTNARQAPGEHLANIIYRCLGFAAPVSGVSQTRYFSEIIPGVKTLNQVGLNKERARRILDGFAVDVLTANWDTVGLEFDNIVYEPDSEVPIRIDNGGAFFTRAQGQNKPTEVLHNITELEGLLNPSINPRYAEVFAASEYTKEEFDTEIKKQVKHILKFFAHHGNWKKFVGEVYKDMSVDSRDRVVDEAGKMLNMRTLKLAKTTGLLTDVDMVSEYKDPINLSSAGYIPDNVQSRYDLMKDMPIQGETHFITEKVNHSNLIIKNKAAHEGVTMWKALSIWARPIKERLDIIKRVRNMFKHNKSSTLSAKSVVRGMWFDESDFELTKLFLRGFQPGKTVRLLPSGFSTSLSTAHDFAKTSDMSHTSILLKVNPAENKKLYGMHVSKVPHYSYGGDDYSNEQEIILSDDTSYLVNKMYRQPVSVNGKPKTVIVIYLTQVEKAPLTESVNNDKVDKVWQFAVQMCLLGSVKSEPPTLEQLNEMLEFIKN
jgi:8-oxo-dGTP pyrophosphatase MutT (NUDIX family)